jgi:CheY-like chemotaxis protein
MHEPLSQILQAARRSQSTTSHLLSFSRKQILAAEAFDLAEFLREAQSPISRMIGEDIKLIVAAAPGLPAVWVDKSGLHQAIMNLVVNARDAMPSGGSLTLSAASYRLDGSGRNEFAGAAPGDYVLLEVADSGTGMDAATLERVFDPFFTTKEPGKGTGLGLPMVMGFMRQSHGAVAIRSHSGEGTTVSLLLPLAASAPPATRQPAAASGKAAAATILVVEDDAAVRNLMVAALQKAGYRVLAVSDPANALDMVRSYAGGIDLVISDIIMPGMRGDEMAQQLAAAGCDVATLLVSGYADDKPSGGRPLLRKPFEVTELLDRVEQLLKEGTRPKN